MPTQKPRITDPRFLIIPEIKKTDGRTLDCTGFPEKRIAKEHSVQFSRYMEKRRNSQEKICAFSSVGRATDS